MRHPQARHVGDVAHYYLPYVEEAVESFPGVRVVALRRAREATVEAYVGWLAQRHPGAPADRWRADRAGLSSDPWDRCFPKYPTRSLREGIARYWDEYYGTVEELVARYPQQVRLFDSDRLLIAAGVDGILNWCLGETSEEGLG